MMRWVSTEWRRERSCSIFVCSQLSKVEKEYYSNRYSMQSHLSQLPPARHYSIRCCCSETSCCSFLQCEAPHSQIWKFNNHHSPAHAIRFHVQTTLSPRRELEGKLVLFRDIRENEFVCRSRLTYSLYLDDNAILFSVILNSNMRT